MLLFVVFSLVLGFVLFLPFFFGEFQIPEPFFLLSTRQCKQIRKIFTLGICVLFTVLFLND